MKIKRMKEIKIKIIIDSLNRELTGIGNYTENLIKNLRKFDLSLEYINYKKIDRYNSKIYPNLLKGHFLETYSWYLELPFLIRKEKNIIIHNPSQIPTFFKFKNKSVISVHDLTPLKFPKEHKFGRKILYEFLLPRTLKNASRIIVASKSTKNDILKIFPKINSEKIKVIYYAANENYKVIKNEKKIDYIGKKYNLPNRFILFVGTIEPRKNIIRLLKAFSEVYKKIPIPFVITGKWGWKYKKIYYTYKKLNLEDKVIFTGYIDEKDLPSIYNLATIFVLPSLYEGFGLTPLEAMQCGCPVVTSNVSSLPEIVGNAAIKVSPYSVKEIEDAMYSLLTNKKLRKKYIKKGLKQAKKFSWEKCAKETLEVYQEVYYEN